MTSTRWSGRAAAVAVLPGSSGRPLAQCQRGEDRPRRQLRLAFYAVGSKMSEHDSPIRLAMARSYAFGLQHGSCSNSLSTPEGPVIVPAMN